MKRADKNLDINVHTNGIDNTVNVNVNINPLEIKPHVAVIIASSVIIAATLLAVSLCCPEYFVDVVRLIINIVYGN